MPRALRSIVQIVWRRLCKRAGVTNRWRDQPERELFERKQVNDMPTKDRSSDPFLNHRPSHLQRFSGARSTSETNMTHDDDAMRSRELEAKQQKLYPSTERMRDFVPKASPEATMRTRHADERGEMQKRHHRESQQLLATQESTRNKRLQTSHSMPARGDDNAELERSRLHDRHSRDREALDRRHLVERDRLRAVR